MLFNSMDFLIFFPIVIAVYFVIPRKTRYIWLLITSYYFYMSWNPKYAILIAASTVITYACSLLIERATQRGGEKGRKISLVSSLVLNLGILFVFKYANFLISTVSRLMSMAGLTAIDRRLDILLPVGISFYTFQALSYTFDVYRGRINAERNLLKYALFVSFFPQLVAGPIERSENLLPQVQNADKINLWNFENIKNGFFLMVWGFFEKLVISDRAGLFVNNVINGYEAYGFAEISIAIILFAVQIYCDFGGYTHIAQGAARVMGFNLMDNFKQPYFAETIKDFWRRWHISLTSWFTDYLYIPLGGNRHGIIRKYLNILIVFGVSGLWHGAGWNYVIWGLLHAVYQIVGDAKKIIINKVRAKCRYGFNNIMTTEKGEKVVEASISTKIRHRITTFLLVDFAWIFFVCDSTKHALAVIRQMFVHFKTTNLLESGLCQGDWNFLFFGILVLLLVDHIHETGGSVLELLSRQELWFRWLVYFILIWSVILFGIYGIAYDSSTFIYFQF